jgi:hypothetical protein
VNPELQRGFEFEDYCGSRFFIVTGKIVKSMRGPMKLTHPHPAPPNQLRVFKHSIIVYFLLIRFYFNLFCHSVAGG